MNKCASRNSTCLLVFGVEPFGGERLSGEKLFNFLNTEFEILKETQCLNLNCDQQCSL